MLPFPHAVALGLPVAERVELGLTGLLAVDHLKAGVQRVASPELGRDSGKNFRDGRRRSSVHLRKAGFPVHFHDPLEWSGGAAKGGASFLGGFDLRFGGLVVRLHGLGLSWLFCCLFYIPAEIIKSVRQRTFPAFASFANCARWAASLARRAEIAARMCS